MYKSLAAITLDNLGRQGREADPAEAHNDLDRAIDFQRQALQSSPNNPDYQGRLAGHYWARARILLRLGKHAGAAEDANAYLRLNPDDANRQWRAAGRPAKCAPLAEKDDALPEADRQTLARQYGSRAVELRALVSMTGAKTAADLETTKEFDCAAFGADFGKLRDEWPQKSHDSP